MTDSIGQTIVSKVNINVKRSGESTELCRVTLVQREKGETNRSK